MIRFVCIASLLLFAAEASGQKPDTQQASQKGKQAPALSQEELVRRRDAKRTSPFLARGEASRGQGAQGHPRVLHPLVRALTAL